MLKPLFGVALVLRMFLELTLRRSFVVVPVVLTRRVLGRKVVNLVMLVQVLVMLPTEEVMVRFYRFGLVRWPILFSLGATLKCPRPRKTRPTAFLICQIKSVNSCSGLLSRGWYYVWNLLAMLPFRLPTQVLGRACLLSTIRLTGTCAQ